MTPTRSNDVFGRRRDAEDDEPPEPADDAVVFDVRRRQQRLRETGHAHTRRVMAQCWDNICESLRRERYRMKRDDE